MIQNAINDALGKAATISVGVSSLKAAKNVIKQAPGFKQAATNQAKQQLGFTGNKANAYQAVNPDDANMRIKAVERLSQRIQEQTARREVFNSLREGFVKKIIGGGK